MLTAKEREELTAILRRQRRALFENVAAAERELELVAGERESELEERAQAERRARVAARLDDRGKREIEEIDVALRHLVRDVDAREVVMDADPGTAGRGGA